MHCTCQNNGDYCTYCERTRETVFNIFVNVNKLGESLARYQSERMTLAACQTTIEVHKRTAVARILAGSTTPEANGTQWDRFLSNSN